MANLFGKVSLWKNDFAAGNEKSPVLRGSIQDEDGNVIADIALWANNSDNSKAPTLKGTIKPPYKKDGGSAPVSKEASYY
jgi:hypothetical protein